MTPETVAIIGNIVDRYGLPIAVLLLAGVGLMRRYVILGSEKQQSDAAWMRELEYREERRKDERAGRLAAEAALRRQTEALGRITDALERLTDVVMDSLQKGGPP